MFRFELLKHAFQQNNVNKTFVCCLSREVVYFFLSGLHLHVVVIYIHLCLKTPRPELTKREAVSLLKESISLSTSSTPHVLFIELSLCLLGAGEVTSSQSGQVDK